MLVRQCQQAFGSARVPILRVELPEIIEWRPERIDHRFGLGRSSWCRPNR